MSNSLREVKLRMTSTQKTAQITKAMNMVSASKLRRAEKTYSDYKAFMKQLDDVDKDVIIGGCIGFAVVVALTIIHIVCN